jgi:hypothetical protein
MAGIAPGPAAVATESSATAIRLAFLTIDGSLWRVLRGLTT